MKKHNLLFIGLLMTVMSSYAQSVGINANGSAPNSSAMLDVNSNTKGFLLPRMTTSEIALISGPADGLLVYNTDDGKLYVYVSSSDIWKEVSYGVGTISTSFICGNSFLDTRDNQSYPTIIIGTQCWMAKNLNVGFKINTPTHQTDNSIIEKYCYVNDDAYCNIYGGLYQWSEMMQYVSTESTTGICPNGWHIPSNNEWTTLTNYLGGVSIAGGEMKEAGTTHWISPNTDATNDSGFTGLPGGDSFNSQVGYFGYWWTSTQYSVNAWNRSLNTYNGGVGADNTANKSTGISVRCLKD